MVDQAAFHCWRLSRALIEFNVEKIFLRFFGDNIILKGFNQGNEPLRVPDVVQIK